MVYVVADLILAVLRGTVPSLFRHKSVGLCPHEILANLGVKESLLLEVLRSTELGVFYLLIGWETSFCPIKS